METKVFDWNENINKEELKEVIEILNNDGIVIFPTDTVYGIGCNCFSEKAIDKIFVLKGRDYSKPINVLVPNIDKMNDVVANIKPIEKELVNKYMPGALTIIFDKKDNVSSLLTAGLNTVGVRIPNNDISLEMLNNVNYPLATTSANLSGEDSLTDFDSIYKLFNGKVDVIINGGISDIGIASTIVRVENDNIKILRQGSIKI